MEINSFYEYYFPLLCRGWGKFSSIKEAIEHAENNELFKQGNFFQVFAGYAPFMGIGVNEYDSRYDKK